MKNLPTKFPAMFVARPPPLNARPAKLEAWLNLSHLEKATLFVRVRTSAITEKGQLCQPLIKVTQVGVALPSSIEGCGTHRW